MSGHATPWIVLRSIEKEEIWGYETGQMTLEPRGYLVTLATATCTAHEPKPPRHALYIPQRNAWVWTGASHKSRISSSTAAMVIEHPAISSEVT